MIMLSFTNEKRASGKIMGAQLTGTTYLVINENFRNIGTFLYNRKTRLVLIVGSSGQFLFALSDEPRDWNYCIGVTIIFNQYIAIVDCSALSNKKNDCP